MTISYGTGSGWDSSTGVVSAYSTVYTPTTGTHGLPELSTHEYVVPAGVYQVRIDCWGSCAYSDVTYEDTGGTIPYTNNCVSPVITGEPAFGFGAYISGVFDCYPGGAFVTSFNGDGGTSGGSYSNCNIIGSHGGPSVDVRRNSLSISNTIIQAGGGGGAGGWDTSGTRTTAQGGNACNWKDWGDINSPTIDEQLDAHPFSVSYSFQLSQWAMGATAQTPGTGGSSIGGISPVIDGMSGYPPSYGYNGTDAVLFGGNGGPGARFELPGIETQYFWPGGPGGGGGGGYQPGAGGGGGGGTYDSLWVYPDTTHDKGGCGGAGAAGTSWIDNSQYNGGYRNYGYTNQGAPWGAVIITPNPPITTITAPANGTVTDMSTTGPGWTLTWESTNAANQTITQDYYSIRRRLVGSSVYSYWQGSATGWLPVTENFVAHAGSTLTFDGSSGDAFAGNGSVWAISVAIIDTDGRVGSYSNEVIIQGVEAPTVSFTNTEIVSGGGVYNYSNCYFSWDPAPAFGQQYTGWELSIYDLDTGKTIVDTGEVYGTDTSFQLPPGTELLPNTSGYTVTLTMWQNGNQTTQVSANISVSYTLNATGAPTVVSKTTATGNPYFEVEAAGTDVLGVVLRSTDSGSTWQAVRASYSETATINDYEVPLSTSTIYKYQAYHSLGGGKYQLSALTAASAAATLPITQQQWLVDQDTGTAAPCFVQLGNLTLTRAERVLFVTMVGQENPLTLYDVIGLPPGQITFSFPNLTWQKDFESLQNLQKPLTLINGNQIIYLRLGADMALSYVAPTQTQYAGSAQVVATPAPQWYVPPTYGWSQEDWDQYTWGNWGPWGF